MPTVKRAPAFDRQFKKKTNEMQVAILECLSRLAAGDTSRGLGVKKMSGFQHIYEARVDGANRVTFEKSGDVITLRANCNHDILRNP